MAQRAQYSFYNRADAATLSGGSWLAGAPLTNLQQRFLSRRARSTNDAEASTRVDIDLGTAAQPVRLIAFTAHNLSLEATWRITAGTSAGASDIYDSGTIQVWPRIYLPEDLPYESENWFTGQATAADTEGYTPPLRHIAPAHYRARYWRIQISDTDNPDTYVELARLWLGPLWQPLRNYDFGSSLVWEPRTVTEQSLGGVLYHDGRAPVRVLRLRLPMLDPSEAWGELLDAQRRLGTTGELWVIPDADDIARSFKRDLFCRFRAFDPIAQIENDVHETTIELEQLL
jgi:hypothetical protein